MVFGLGKKKLTDSPTKTRRGFFGRIMQLLGASDVSDQMWDQLEELLILADAGVETTLALVERLREMLREERLAWMESQRYFVERSIQNAKPEIGWEHQAALTVLASWFVAQTQLDWAQRFSTDPSLAAELGVDRLPELCYVWAYRAQNWLRSGYGQT